MLFSFIYQSILAALACAYLPKAAYDYVVKGKYKKSLLQRLGKRSPPLKNTSSPLIWIHAVSVGETKAIATLAKMIKQRHPSFSLLVSSITETGHEEVLRSIPETDYAIFLPLDFSCCIGPLIKKFSPRLILLSETDIWWNFLHQAKKHGAEIAIVNGKLSERSCKRLHYFPALGKRLYEGITLCCAQTEEYASRFKSLNIPEVIVTGNTKFDFPACSTQLPVLPQEFDWIVLGSTHQGEEEILLHALLPHLQKIDSLKLVIAPRHPERFDAVACYLQELKIPYNRFSENSSFAGKILLLDAMGILSRAYSQAKLAIVGGSFVPGIGGHNIIEPCLAGTPVLFGPYMDTQKEMVSYVKSYYAGKQLSAQELSSEIAYLLSSPEKLQSLAEGCKLLSNSVQGATENTYQAIYPWLEQCESGR